MKRRGDILDATTAEYLCTDQYPDWLWRKLETFQDWRFGLFMHWGPYSIYGCDASWSLQGIDNDWCRYDGLKPWEDCGRDPAAYREGYLACASQFNPVNFNPEGWAELAEYAGMKYMVLTSKHHDGFCMFDTATTDYRITAPNCPFASHPRANILRETFDAFRAKGFGIGCYFSKPDWSHPDFWDQSVVEHRRGPDYEPEEDPERWQRFVDFTHRQFEELMTGYGPIDSLWLDGGWCRTGQYDVDIPTVAEMARRHHPELLVCDRSVGGLYENVITPEQLHDLPRTPMGHPWEICVTLAKSWGYVEGEPQKPARQIIHLLADVVAKNGNLLLNVGPRADGTYPPEAVDRLRSIGDWMQVNGEAIHGTRAIEPWSEGNIRYTSKGDTVYAIVLSASEDAPMPSTVRLSALQPAAGNAVSLLGHGGELTVHREEGDTVITLPETAPCDHAWTLKFRITE
jgi:alpha-L-fucosidase